MRIEEYYAKYQEKTRQVISKTTEIHTLKIRESVKRMNTINVIDSMLSNNDKVRDLEIKNLRKKDLTKVIDMNVKSRLLIKFAGTMLQIAMRGNKVSPNEALLKSLRKTLKIVKGDGVDTKPLVEETLKRYSDPEYNILTIEAIVTGTKNVSKSNPALITMLKANVMDNAIRTAAEYHDIPMDDFPSVEEFNDMLRDVYEREARMRFEGPGL